MANRLKALAVLLGALICFNAVACAHTPYEVFEVVEVTPTRGITHEIDLKGPFDSGVIETHLKGPQLFSHAVGFGEQAAEDGAAYLNWYKIEKPAAGAKRILSVSDKLRGDKARKMTIQGAAFLLAPAQRVATGPPRAIPPGLDYFKAYAIVDGQPLNRKVKLTGTFGPQTRLPTKAAFLCVPVEKWHHDKHVPIKNVRPCMLVYELPTRECKAGITTIDLFGMNSLDARASKYLCVPARIVDDTAADVQ